MLHVFEPVFVFSAITCFCKLIYSSKPGVGNRQSIAGRIDCVILSAGHIHSQFESFVLKIHYVANLLSIHAELFFTAKIRDFYAFFMPRKQYVVEYEAVFKKCLRFLFYQFVVHSTKF